MARYARQAIVTKYIMPTDTRPTRIKAVAQAGSITLTWDQSKNDYDNHEFAAMALVKKLGWDKALHGCELVGGALPDKTINYAWVNINTNK